jgi:hypothetical protein
LPAGAVEAGAREGAARPRGLEGTSFLPRVGVLMNRELPSASW